MQNVLERTKSHSLALLLAGALVASLSSPAVAQEEEPAVNTGKVSFSVGSDFATSYIFRGYEQEDSGFIAQPYAEIGVNVFSGDGFINSVDVMAGIWNSFHSEQTLSSGTNDAWYESDLYAGVSVGFAEKFTFDFAYIAYTYPNGAFDTIHELDFGLSYDDSDLWGGNFALNPYGLVAVEIDDTNAGATDDIYIELGIEPGTTIDVSEKLSLDVSFPVTLGLSGDDYYVDAAGDDEFFGYVSFGPMVGMPLGFIPPEYGSWSATAGVLFYVLNDDAGLTDDGDDFEVVGIFGISMDY